MESPCGRTRAAVSAHVTGFPPPFDLSPLRGSGRAFLEDEMKIEVDLEEAFEEYVDSIGTRGGPKRMPPIELSKKVYALLDTCATESEMIETVVLLFSENDALKIGIYEHCKEMEFEP